MGYTHFSKDERNEISILLKRGYSHREIGSALRKDHSSISREIKRNSIHGKYDPQKAQHKAYVKRKYSKYQGMKIRENLGLQSYIEEKMKKKWSPEQIAGRLKFENDGKTIISFKGIYKYLYSIYGQKLCQYLTYKRVKRKKRKKTKSKREIIKDRVFIDQRPEEINQRKRFGDFEGDTLGVPKSSKETIVGLIERQSRYLMAQKIPQLKYAMNAFKKLLAPIPALSVTFDNGVENIHHKELAIPTYFCHPYSSWEKGSIENAFGLLREYIPKKANLSKYTDEEISAIVEEINNTPRKCLGFKTPKEVFEEQCSSKFFPRSKTQVKFLKSNIFLNVFLKALHLRG